MNRPYGWQNGGFSLLSIAGSWRDQTQTSRSIAAAVALTTAAAAGAVAAINPVLLLAVCVATVATIAITSPAARFTIVLAGGLFVFRGSDQLDASKLGYLAWVAVCTALAMARFAKDQADRRVGDARPLLVASVAVLVAIAVSLVVALSVGTPFIDSMRDAAPYGLLAVAPLLGWDGARSRLGPHMEAVAVAAGLMASTAFAVEWLGRRGLADLPFATFGSSSVALSALVFVVAIAALLSRRPRRLLWAMLAAVVISLLFVTGTRSTLVLLVGPAAMVLAGTDRFRRLARLAGAAVVIGALALTFLLLAGQSALIDVVRLANRLGSIVSLGSDLSVDQSFMERVTQVGVASSAFAGSPVVGVGLGFRFEWTRFGGESFPSYTIDTGLSIAAKFGLVGLGLFGIATTAALSFFRGLRLRLPEHVRLSFVGFAAVSIAMLPLGNPLEDKGFGLAVAILVPWALASARTARTNSNTVAEMPSRTPGIHQRRTASRRVTPR